MNDDALREYRQDFALAVLLRNPEPLSAGDVAEHIAVLAQADGHPDECWRGADPTAVSGHLRALETRGLVKKAGDRRNHRAGRPEPIWEPTSERFPAGIPLPPDREEVETFELSPPPPAPENPYEDLSRPQLYQLLAVQDEIAGACYRFLREIQELNERARQKLAATGIEVPGA